MTEEEREEKEERRENRKEEREERDDRDGSSNRGASVWSRVAVWFLLFLLAWPLLWGVITIVLAESSSALSVLLAFVLAVGAVLSLAIYVEGRRKRDHPAQGQT